MPKQGATESKLGIRKPYTIHLVGSADSGNQLAQKCLSALGTETSIAHIEGNSANVYFHETSSFVILDFICQEKLNADPYPEEGAIILAYDSTDKNSESHMEKVYENIYDDKRDVQTGDNTQPSVLIVANAVEQMTSDDLGVLETGKKFAEAKNTLHLETSPGNVENVYEEIKRLAIQHANKYLQIIPKDGEELIMESVVLHGDPSADARQLLKIFCLEETKAAFRAKYADDKSKEEKAENTGKKADKYIPEEQPFQRQVTIEHVKVQLNIYDREAGISLASSTMVGVPVDKGYPDQITAVMLMYNSSDSESPKRIKDFYKLMKEYPANAKENPGKLWSDDIPVVIVANKYDPMDANNRKAFAKGEAFAKDIGITHFAIQSNATAGERSNMNYNAFGHLAQLYCEQHAVTDYVPVDKELYRWKNRNTFHDDSKI